MGFTDQDPEGFQVEGFEHEPTIATYSNFPYMAELLESNGYRKEVDYVVYKVPVPLRISKLDEAIAARALGRGGYRLLEFRTRRQLKPFVRPILEIMNETFEGLYGYVTLGREEMDELARKFWLFLDPRFVKVAVRGSLSVAFLIAVPNADPGFRRARGRLFPFGLLQIVAASRRSRQLDLLAAAVRREDRGRGLDAVGMAAILRSAIAAGFQVLDSHLELETNRLVRAEMERLGGVVCKRYRIFQRRIDGESDRS